MKNNRSINKGLSFSITFLFIFLTVTPLVIGYNVKKPDNATIAEKYDCYHISEIPKYIQHRISKESNIYDSIESEKTIQLLDSPPMDSPWPMYCYDVRHTGRSPYSTANNSGYEKWQTSLDTWVGGSPVIDNNGVIYIGSHTLYAIYPNGTLKWKFDGYIRTVSAPAIDENGIVYIGSIWAMPNYLYAIYTSNGTLKWKYSMGSDDIFSSPSIGDDGTIYFGSGGDYPWYGHINALYPNGTLRWKYETSYEVYSSPAISNDGTVYCGSHDGYLYALYPNNGTLKWKFKTGDWIARGPSIADDGTIYFGSWDGYLYAVYPDGTLKWKTGGYLAGTTPITGSEGTIYVGNKKLYAIYPENGTVKWSFNLSQNEDIRGSNPCISADGTIYFGTFEGGRIYAVNNDGTEKWRKSIGGDILSAPAIGEDGTVYIGDGRDDGCFHAFGPLNSDAPSAPDIDGPNLGISGIDYNFSFVSTEPNNQRIRYYVDWGDRNTIETDYHESGEVVILNHTWIARKTYTIKAIAEDFYGEQSNESSFEIIIPRNKVVNFSFNLLSWFLERFPILQKLLFF